MLQNDLPPLMGFPEEEYCKHLNSVPFYTCVIKPYRVFVYHAIFVNAWRIELIDASHGVDMFVGAGSQGFKWDMPYSDDPLTLLSVIHKVTSEGTKLGE